MKKSAHCTALCLMMLYCLNIASQTHEEFDSIEVDGKVIYKSIYVKDSINNKRFITYYFENSSSSCMTQEQIKTGAYRMTENLDSLLTFNNSIKQFVLKYIDNVQLEYMIEQGPSTIAFSYQLDDCGQIINAGIGMYEYCFNLIFSKKQIYNLLKEIVTEFHYRQFCSKRKNINSMPMWTFGIKRKDLIHEKNRRHLNKKASAIPFRQSQPSIHESTCKSGI
jgi:hypothetical protein